MEDVKIPRMETIAHTAELTGIPVYAIRQMVAKREIVFIRCGNKVLVNLTRFIEKLNAGDVSV